MSKKADLSIGIIIAAAIGVLVLVVVGSIFMGQMKKTNTTINSCDTVQGDMVDINTGCDDTQTEMKGYGNSTHVCCVDFQSS